MSDISLHVPRYEELYYRQKILKDPETMSYNAGYGLGFEGYDDQTGCIDFPESEWENWYKYFVGSGSERFYAYVYKRNTGFIGEVNLHRTGGENAFAMGIVIESEYRGKGYGKIALRLLLQYAFGVLGANAVTNSFENTRVSAAKAHLAAGFKIENVQDGITKYKITKSEFTESLI